MYLGMLLILCAWTIWLGNLFNLTVLPLFVWYMTKFQIIPEETALADRVVAGMQAPASTLAGATDLGSLKAILRRCRVLVCNDAGARHVAVALGVPCVVLMGPTSLETTGLNLDSVHVVDTEVACRPCYQRVCPIDHRCMTRLEPARVSRAMLDLLGPLDSSVEGPARCRAGNIDV